MLDFSQGQPNKRINRTRNGRTSYLPAGPLAGYPRRYAATSRLSCNQAYGILALKLGENL